MHWRLRQGNFIEVPRTLHFWAQRLVNVRGVALAIALGGPGATFWMIVCGLIGMSTKFVECTLGVKYQMPFITTTMNILFGTKYVYMARLAGIVTGLAWTRVGGDILFIESTRAQGT